MKKIPDVKLILDKMSEEDKIQLAKLVESTRSAQGFTRTLLLYKMKKLLEKWS
jgi:hypothetical protein